MLNRLTLTALLATLALAHSARADWTLTTGDFTEQKNLTVNTWDPAEGLSVTDNTGKLIRLDSRNVLGLASTTTKINVGANAAWKLSLRNGDVLYGEPVSISGQSLEYKIAEVGTIAIPLKLVSTITAFKAPAPGAVESATPAPAAGGATDKDTIFLNNNDKLEGLIVNVDPQKIQIAVGTSNDTTDIALNLVNRLTFGGVTAPRSVPPLSARLTFATGSVITLPLDPKQKSFAWTIHEVAFKDLAGQDRKAKVDSIASIDILGGRVVALTEIDPAKDEQTTLMGTKWETQINRNVMGQPLRVAKKVYSRGLGVHTRSNLTYELDGTFDTLKLKVGMDDSSAPQGSADVAVLLDGKILWEAKALKAGATQVSEDLELPIKGGKKLELRATSALGNGKVDVLGRVNWLNVALTRP
jgi:hypothetical protein